MSLKQADELLKRAGGMPNRQRQGRRFRSWFPFPSRTTSHRFQFLELPVQQIANPLDAQVGGRVGCQHFWIPSVVSLPHEDGCHPPPPDSLDGGENAQLVIHNYIMSRRIPGFHIGQLAFLMNVNQHVSINRFIKSGAVHFAGLEDDVAVSKKNGCPPLLGALDNVERTREDAVGEGIGYEETRNGQQAQVMRVLAAATLQGAQIIGVTKPGSQLLESGPVTPRPLGPDLALEIFAEVGDDLVVIEQRIVHVEEKNDFARN